MCPAECEFFIWICVRLRIEEKKEERERKEMEEEENRTSRRFPFVSSFLSKTSTPLFFHTNKKKLRSKQIRFGLMSPDEIVRTSELQVFERQLYNVSFFF